MQHYLERLNLQKQESVKIGIKRPLSELLISNTEESPFDKDVKNSPELILEIEKRKNFIQNLDLIYKKFPNQSNEELTIFLREAADLFNNSDTRRILLYFPFELIPDEKFEDFRESYKKNWLELLSQEDYRVNFNDGDILEPELLSYGGQPKVRKAAHLLPILIQKNIIEFKDIFKIIENNSEKVLKHSFFDTFPVLIDMNLLNKEDIELMQNSTDKEISNMYILLKDEQNQILEENNNYNITDIINDIDSFEKTRPNNINSNKTEARIAWENNKEKDTFVDKKSTELAILYNTQKLDFDSFKNFLGKDELKSLIFIKLMGKIIYSDLELKEFEEYINLLNKNENPIIKENLNNFWSKLEHKKINSKYTAEILPNEILENTKDFINAQNIIEGINKSELGKYLYPAMILYGSKIKGYGGKTADTDTAIFIKTNIDIEEKLKIEEDLEKIFKKEGYTEKPLEFWLKENETGLEVRDLENTDSKIGKSYTINVLWNGAWVGDEKEIEDLQKKLLTPYLYLGDKKINGIKIREVFLRELERDTLQYRLMHKGYAKYHSPISNLKTKNSKDIDSESMFWDSGYRRLATRLFAEKVFLPNLKKEK